jgi:hypothetical protein
LSAAQVILLLRVTVITVFRFILSERYGGKYSRQKVRLLLAKP